MQFQSGKAKTGGRQVGTPNKLTAAFKEAVAIVYNTLGGHEAFAEWAKLNQGEFYKICARLIPGEMRAESPDDRITVIIAREQAHTLDAPTLPVKLERP